MGQEYGSGNILTKGVAELRDLANSLTKYINQPEVKTGELADINDKVMGFFKLINEANSVELNAENALHLYSTIDLFHKTLNKKYRKLNGKAFMAADVVAVAVKEKGGKETVAHIAQLERKAEITWKELAKLERVGEETEAHRIKLYKDKCEPGMFEIAPSTSTKTAVKNAENRFREGKDYVEYIMSNENLGKSLQALKHAVKKYVYEEIRFAGITGGGDQYLKLVAALSEVNKEMESIAAIDLSYPQTLNLTKLANIENDMTKKSLPFDIRPIEGSMSGYGEVSDQLTFTSNAAYHRGGFGDNGNFYLGGRGRKGHRGGVEIGQTVRILDESLKRVGEISIDKVTHSASLKAETKDGKVLAEWDFQLPEYHHPDEKYYMIPHIKLTGSIPVINTFTADIVGYLKDVNKEDAPNVIYISNAYGWDYEGKPGGLGRGLARIVLSEDKFKDGTLLAYARANGGKLSIMAKEGEKFRYVLIDGTRPLIPSYYNPNDPKSELQDHLTAKNYLGRGMSERTRFN